MLRQRAPTLKRADTVTNGCARALAGCRLVVSGPSGLGKSLLLRVIASLDCPLRGRVELHEQGKPPIT
jgi:ABC-type sulfate/molybdate transport systems ATPase subunit